ncbi:hypothetical protein EDD18DRAFT_1129088 [Armillaria luteobubalina]|uniref:F-box domain-containing protein n=1 Tax=Armillaria luteobubalina TaxID=153913 RepID=A0AA39QP62_9AGAR|nr:hypothetical protein EDD18DRAFT_1129088 [Armillaria luteobubalina]
MNASTEACPACTLAVNLDNYEHILSSIDCSVPDNLNPYIYGNFFPPSAICTEIEHSLGRLQKQFLCFDQVFARQQMAISQVASVLKNYEEAYAKTLSGQIRVQEIMDLHKSTLSSPIRSLPDGLLVLIFQLASPNAAFMDQFPWVATRVCRQWRAVAHYNRILWSEFTLASVSVPVSLWDDDLRAESNGGGWGTPPREQSGRYPGREVHWILEPSFRRALVEVEQGRKRHEIPRPAISQKIVRQALEYSSSVPLTFSLDFAGVPFDYLNTALGYLDMFVSQAARWRNVKIHLEGSLFKSLPLIKNGLPLLESLDLYLTNDSILPFPTDVFIDAPRLCNVKLHLYSQAEVMLPWKQLKELSIFFQFPLSEDYCLQILRRGFLLETLRLQQRQDSRHHSEVLVGGSSETNLHTHRMTTLPYLRMLEINSGMSPLLNYICVPKLSSLTLCGDADSMELHLFSLIERSNSVVEELSYSSTFVTDSFTRLLRVFPSLTSLTLDVSNLNNKTFFCAISQKALLPSLKDFSVRYVDASHGYMVLIIDMLEAHQSCLKRFDLTLSVARDWGRYERTKDWVLGTHGAKHSRLTSSAKSEATQDGWLASSEKARLRALSNAGMKIRIGKCSPAWGDFEISYVNLGSE